MKRCSFTHVETRANPGEIYDDAYYEGCVCPDNARERRTLQRNASHRLEVLRPLLPPASKVFEVGYAYGFFLHGPAADGVS